MESKPVPTTWKRFRYMLRDFSIPQLQHRGRHQDGTFEYDGANHPTDRRGTHFLKQRFKDGRVISLNFPRAWFPRSPDITLCDF